MDRLLHWLGLADPASAAARAELAGMSDAQLADLGIARGQIAAYVAGRLAPPPPRRRPALRVIRGGLAA